jgi:hypothetical protein
VVPVLIPLCSILSQLAQDFKVRPGSQLVKTP